MPGVPWALTSLEPRSGVWNINDKVLKCAECNQEFVFTRRRTDVFRRQGLQKPSPSGARTAKPNALRGPGPIPIHSKELKPRQPARSAERKLQFLSARRRADLCSAANASAAAVHERTGVARAGERGAPPLLGDSLGEFSSFAARLDRTFTGGTISAFVCPFFYFPRNKAYLMALASRRRFFFHYIANPALEKINSRGKWNIQTG